MATNDEIKKKRVRMNNKNEDELALLATDKEFKRVFKKAMSELEKNEGNEYKYKIHISRVVPLLRSFIFVSKRIYDEARAEGHKEGQQEQLAEDIRIIKKLFADNEKDEPYETTLEEILHALQQSKANSD